MRLLQKNPHGRSIIIDKKSAFLLGGFLLFFIDQGLKYTARAHTDFSWYLWKPWLGWEYFANAGIAFSLPFPRTLILLTTPFLLAALAAIARKRPSAFLIVFGALGNFLDRVFFGHTIDYIRVATGIFNIADFIILIGLLALFFRR